MSRENPEPWVPESIPERITVLGKLIEEASELIKVASRCLIQGVEEHDPETLKQNRQALEEEIADVYACINVVEISFGLSSSAIHRRIADKKQFYRKWHHLIKTKNDEVSSTAT